MGLDTELTESAKMLATSIAYGGSMTYDDICKLDWLKNISYYGISFYLETAIRKGWIKAKCREDKPTIYSITTKGRKMVKERI